MADRGTMSTTVADAGALDLGGDLTVHRLGFGAMRLTGAGIWGEPDNPEECRLVLRRALELGVTFIDTADSYGPEVSERLIAEALFPYPDQLVIATKGGLLRPGPGRWEPNGRPDHLRAACEGSLRRLRLDAIDLYQLHRPDPKIPLEESLGALLDLKDQGKIRHIGISNVTVDQLRQAQRATTIVCVQNRYSLTDRELEPVLEECSAMGIPFIPWRPLADEVRAGSAVAEIARRVGATPAQVALAWLLAHSPVLLPIPGTSSVAHLEENCGAAQLDLAPSDLKALDEVH